MIMNLDRCHLAATLHLRKKAIFNVSLAYTVVAKQNPTFAANFGVLAVDLADRYLKKPAAKDNLIIRRARQTRKRACGQL